MSLYTVSPAESDKTFYDAISTKTQFHLHHNRLQIKQRKI